MSSPISRRPGGLLDLLLAQQQGKNPTLLEDTVAPVIDLTEFYATDRLTVTNAVKNFTGVNITEEITIPAAEQWWVRSVSATGAFATVNQTIRFDVIVDNVPSNSTILHSSGQLAAVGATDRWSFAFYLPSPLIFPPGVDFRFRATEINLDAQANIQATLTVMYTRMEV